MSDTTKYITGSRGNISGAIYRKGIRKAYSKPLLAGFIALSFCACAEDDPLDAGNTASRADAISFNVTSGITSGIPTRSQSPEKDDTTGLLQPLILKSGETEIPLYLHTYVADERTDSGIPTRASQVNTLNDLVALNRADGFRLEAYDAKGTTFIPGYAVAKPESGDEAENVWNTNPTYYWPVDNRMLGFYAYAPASAGNLLKNMSADNDGKTIRFDYEVPKGSVTNNYHNDAEIQPDLMFAITECNKTTSVDGKVPLNFRHSLSAIKFAVRDVVGGTIERISIAGVAGKARCVYTRTSNPAKDEFVWSGHTEANSSYTQTFNYETTDKTTGDEVLNVRMPSKTFLLIPQEIPSDARIEVVFKRAYDNQTFTMSGNIRDNDVTKWEPGKEYIYTISTGSSNWIYCFEVLGSEQERNDDEPAKGTFKDSDRIIINQTVTEGGYYKVLSYRMRANNLQVKEPVAWNITNISDGVTTKPAEFNFDVKISDLTPDVWIPAKTMAGGGSAEYVKYSMEFYPQMTGTDYGGDWDLRERDELGSADSPLDMSTIYGSVSTANCYVVNAPGYFKFPLVYGNAVKNGATNNKCYTYTAPKSYNLSGTYPSLTKFVDYQGNEISGPGIKSAKDAVLVWEDAYNLISEVKLNPQDGNYGTVSFKVNRENLQQGNAVLAIRDSQKRIIWSWHIWISDHWTNKGSLKLTGDVAMPTYDNGYVSGNRFYAAPRNLGWCDAKDIWYFRRNGTITFVQQESNLSVTLPVEQREVKIEYWIGNNTYYQFGRKDPIVGFMNTGSVVKYNFGPYPYQIEPQTRTIQYGIEHPNILFVGADAVQDNNDWLNTHYQNLWNNTTETPPADGKTPASKTIKYHYAGVKTVYDPCPVGYMVPPVGFFKKITNARTVYQSDKLEFNGTQGLDERGQIIYKANTDTAGEYLILYGTGHRWYANSGGGIPAGGNFNPAIAYLWSNQINFTIGNHSAYGLALGGDDNVSYFHFEGRRSMARPVRPVKEL